MHRTEVDSPKLLEHEFCELRVKLFGKSGYALNEGLTRLQEEEKKSFLAGWCHQKTHDRDGHKLFIKQFLYGTFRNLRAEGVIGSFVHQLLRLLTSPTPNRAMAPPTIAKTLGISPSQK